MATWLTILCPSCRPNDLKRWLDSLHTNAVDPKSIELSLTLEETLDLSEYERWGGVKITLVKHGEYNVNQLQEMCYKQSTSPFVMLSGDDTICRTANWDAIFKAELDKYPDNVILVYPNDLIFGESLACYPVVSRLVMDHMAWPIPFKRYAIDDTIFDIVPRKRRIYLKDVIMEHLHLRDEGPGVPVVRDGVTKYYPIDQEYMAIDRPMYNMLEPQRNATRQKLEAIAGIVQTGKVMICVPTQEFARRADFYDYYNALEKIEGTMATFSHGQSPARNRNIMIRIALKNNATHCLFLDDDMAFKPDLLKRLLAHDQDIVGGLYLMRNYPHLPVMFKTAYKDGKCKYRFLEPNTSGLVEVVNMGFGACLIKTDVFRKMCGDNDPEEFMWVTLGELDRDHWSDDISFFNRARKAGYKIYVDTDAACGHIMSCCIWPQRDPHTGQWYTMYNTGAPEMFQIAQHIPSQEQQDKQNSGEVELELP